MSTVSGRDWLVILPWVGTTAALLYAIRVRWQSKGNDTNKSHVNLCQQKDCPKVAHSFDIEDLGSKVSLCRCWRSSKFPYCDGTHNRHNESTGDNVGPINLRRKTA